MAIKDLLRFYSGMTLIACYYLFATMVMFMDGKLTLKFIKGTQSNQRKMQVRIQDLRLDRLNMFLRMSKFIQSAMMKSLIYYTYQLQITNFNYYLQKVVKV